VTGFTDEETLQVFTRFLSEQEIETYRADLLAFAAAVERLPIAISAAASLVQRESRFCVVLRRRSAFIICRRTPTGF
jgi:hypothetical protein